MGEGYDTGGSVLPVSCVQAFYWMDSDDGEVMAETATKERPILFSGEMVRAILDDRKTQTRRIADRVAGFGKVRQFGPSDTPGYDYHFRCRRGLWQDFRLTELLERCPFGQPGDQIWVRETWNCLHPASEVPIPPNPRPMVCSLAYAATESERHAEYPNTSKLCCKWRPSIHMPRWASRITLEITGVRVEQLQEISDQDAVAEGIEILDSFDPEFAARGTFKELWQSINGPESWDLNPWVWVVEFKRVDP